MMQGNPQRDPAPQLERQSARRRAALPVAVAAVAAVLLVAALAGIAAAVGGGADAAASSAVSSAASTPPFPSPAPKTVATPVWQLGSYRSVGFDKTFKAELIDELPSPPQLIVFGGSRAMRFSPPNIRHLTTLQTFNSAVQCFRPEDAWAFSSYLFQRSPGTRLHCVIALQARTLIDDQMRAGLLYDDRLARAFPADLVARQKASLGKPAKKEVLGENRYTARGYLVRNRYDISRERGYDFIKHIDLSIHRMLPNHAWHGPVPDARARSYFEKTMQLYNDHGVTPLIIMMPVQPRALRAFRKAGFQKHLDYLRTYLADAQSRVRFRVLDFTSIRAFGGSATEFYDAVHPTAVNTQRIFARAFALAPECFE